MSKQLWSTRQQLMSCLLLSESLWRCMEPWLARLGDDPEEIGFRVWVQTIAKYFALWGSLPDAVTLATLATQQVQSLGPTQQGIIARDCGAASQMVQMWAQTDQGQQFYAEKGKPLLTDYLTRIVSSSYADRIAKNPEMADSLAAELQRDVNFIKGTLSSAFKSAFPKGYYKSRGEGAFQPVGIDFVDVMCGGGLLEGEVVGHVAPIGQGKTTLIAQVVYSRALQLVSPRVLAAKRAKLAQVDLTSLPQVYLFMFEAVETFLVNYISNAAKIPRAVSMDAMLKSEEDSPFTSRHKRNWAEYELNDMRRDFEIANKRLADGETDIVWPPGERERFDRSVSITDAVVQIVDFSGHDETNRELSERGIDGMAQYIRMHQESLGNPGVNFVAVDFVGAMVDSAIAAGTFKSADRVDIIRTSPNRLSRDIAATFKCPVWAAHQLSPDENKKSGGTMPNPKAADGSGMFLTYCSVGFASGMLNKDNIAIYVLGKQRRLQTSAAEVHLGKLGNKFARWERADDFRYHDGQIMNVKEVARTTTTAGGGMLPPTGGFNAKFAQ